MSDPGSVWRQLSPAEIEAGHHRELVGGMWRELGLLQFEFLKGRGLAPAHRLLDVGCGCLRAGVHFVAYLDEGNYHGVDLNSSLIAAGERELAAASLTHKRPRLLVNGTFEFHQFGVDFDFILAQSVFTHLDREAVARCLAAARRVLAPNGCFYATFFEAPMSRHLGSLRHEPGGVTTRFDSDPYHCSFDEMSELAIGSGLSAELIGDWNHPRAQRMVCLTLAAT